MNLQQNHKNALDKIPETFVNNVYKKFLLSDVFKNLQKVFHFYPTDLVNTKANIPPQGQRTPLDMYLNASHLSIYPPLFISPSGDSCIIFSALHKLCRLSILPGVLFWAGCRTPDATSGCLTCKVQ